MPSSADADAPAGLDLNGLLLTESQVCSTLLGTSSLRALLAYPFLSDTFAPLSDRWDDARTGQPTIDAVIRYALGRAAVLGMCVFVYAVRCLSGRGRR